jgi:phage terminase large subunit GpA-like protein
MSIAEWIEFMQKNEKYDCVVYANAISVPWKKRPARATYLTQPPLLFGPSSLMPLPWDFWSAS